MKKRNFASNTVIDNFNNPVASTCQIKVMGDQAERRPHWQAAVALEPVSADNLRKTGISAVWSRDFRQFRSRGLGDREHGDKVEGPKCRDFRACKPSVANRRKTPDCVAGDAVGFEPVSTQNSLLTGNFTGNSSISGLLGRILTQETPVPQPPFQQFPKRINRENIFRNRDLFGR